MTAYVLTSAAEADLREIIRHTRARWGDAQVRRYMTELEAGIQGLALSRGAFKNVHAIYPGLRMGRSGHHLIFALQRAAAPALIVAVLHERMDLLSRLSDRL